MNDENKKNIPTCPYPLRTIYFYLTQGCNLKCRHCWIAPKFQTKDSMWPYVELDLFKDIVRQGKELGLSGVKLTGGEPLIHPEIDKILHFIKDQNLSLTIETNGVECSEEIAKIIAECKKPFVSISLDGDNADTHDYVRGVNGSFDGAIRGLRNLVKYGLRPQLIMSIMKFNKSQMQSVVKIAERENAESVKFNIVTPTSRGEKMHASGETIPIEELVEIGRWVEYELSASTKIRIAHSHPVAFKPLKQALSNSIGKCGIFGIIGVLGNGKYALCGIGESVPELIFGDAKNDKLVDIWNNNHVLRDIREKLPSKLSGLCADCVMKNSCLGSCVAMNYYRNKDLFSTYWYCEEAYDKGLFPKSRIIPNSKHDIGFKTAKRN